MLFRKDYESLSKRLFDVETRIRGVELAQEDLINKVLRKIQRRPGEQAEQQAAPKVGQPIHK